MIGQEQNFAVWEFGLGTHEHVAVTDLAGRKQLGSGFRVQSCVHDEAKPPLTVMQCCLCCRAGTSTSEETAAKVSAEKLTAEANSARAQAESARKQAESAVAAAESLKAAAESAKAQAEVALTQQSHAMKNDAELISQLKKSLEEQELARRFANAAAEKHSLDAQEATQRAAHNALRANGFSQELEARKKSEEQVLELKKRIAELEQTANSTASQAESDLRDAVAKEGRLRQKFEQVSFACKPCFPR